MAERSTEGLLWTVEHPVWEALTGKVSPDVYNRGAERVRDAVWRQVRELEPIIYVSGQVEEWLRDLPQARAGRPVVKEIRAPRWNAWSGLCPAVRVSGYASGTARNGIEHWVSAETGRVEDTVVREIDLLTAPEEVSGGGEEY